MYTSNNILLIACVKKTSLGESLAESHAYNPIRVSPRVSTRVSPKLSTRLSARLLARLLAPTSLAASLGSDNMHDFRRNFLRDLLFFTRASKKVIYKRSYVSLTIYSLKLLVLKSNGSGQLPVCSTPEC